MPQSTFITSLKRPGEAKDGGLLYPINNMARIFLLDFYKDQYVIPTAVIELLRDYNPFSSKTGLSKKQVIKYLRILLDETPDLAEYLVACLPEAQDLLPPELLSNIPEEYRSPPVKEAIESHSSVNIKRPSADNVNQTSDPDEECVPPSKIQRPTRPKAPPPLPDLLRIPSLSIPVTNVGFELDDVEFSYTTSPSQLQDMGLSPPIIRPPKLVLRPQHADDRGRDPPLYILEESPSKSAVDVKQLPLRPASSLENLSSPTKCISTYQKQPTTTKSGGRKSPRKRKRSPPKNVVILKEEFGGEVMTASELNNQLDSVWENKKLTTDPVIAHNQRTERQRVCGSSTDVDNSELIIPKAYMSSYDDPLEHLVKEAITADNFHEILPALASSFDPPGEHDPVTNPHDPLLGAISSKTPSSSSSVLPLDTMSFPRPTLLDRNFSVEPDLLTENLSLSYLSSSLPDLTEALADETLTSQLVSHHIKPNVPSLHIPIFTNALAMSTQRLHAAPLSPLLYADEINRLSTPGLHRHMDTLSTLFHNPASINLPTPLDHISVPLTGTPISELLPTTPTYIYTNALNIKQGSITSGSPIIPKPAAGSSGHRMTAQQSIKITLGHRDVSQMYTGGRHAQYGLTASPSEQSKYRPQTAPDTTSIAGPPESPSTLYQPKKSTSAAIDLSLPRSVTGSDLNGDRLFLSR